MSTQFSFDLRVARRKSGLTQRDCAHLLDIDATRVSKLECGKKPPTLEEVHLLSLIHNRRFEEFYSELATRAREALLKRLTTIPAARKYAATFNRAHTISRLERELARSKKGI